MTNTSESRVINSTELEFVTFYAGQLLIGANILQVEEINRQLDFTPVPNAPDYVRGVINLRGDVVTVVDLRAILGLDQVEIARTTRMVVVDFRGERMGLLVDRVADVVRTGAEQIDIPPANIRGVDGRYFKGVCKLDSELLVILDVDTVLSRDAEGHVASRSS